MCVCSLWQVCDYCDPMDPEKRHSAEFGVDGAETWWQSPPLSRGMKYNEVNLTIDLGEVSQLFCTETPERNSCHASERDLSAPPRGSPEVRRFCGKVLGVG